MPDLVVVPAAWGVLAAALLAAFSAAAAGADAVLQARGPRTRALRASTRPVDEVARLLRQRRRTTVEADGLLWRAGTSAPVVVALLMVSLVPLGRWSLTDLGVGLVWFNALDVVVWAAVWLAGWGPNSVHSLVGGYRFLAQALAYELPLMFALTAPAVAASSLRIADIVHGQEGLWYVVWMPVAFVVYCIGLLGFSVSGPLASPFAADVAGGVLAETSAVDRLLLQAGRYALLVAGAAFAVALFLGAGAGPVLPAWAWVLVKTMLLLAVLLVTRRRIPLLRPDRFAELGWMVLLPAALLQVLVVAVVVVRS